MAPKVESGDFTVEVIEEGKKFALKRKDGTVHEITLEEVDGRLVFQGCPNILTNNVNSFQFSE